jgi:hypothetical protein
MTWVRVDLMGFLFGDILAVSKADIAVIWLGGLAVLAILAAVWRPLFAATVNFELAEAEGMRPQRANIILMLLMAAVIAVSMKIVGVLLITALLIIPAASARRFCKRSGANGIDCRRYWRGGGDWRTVRLARVGHPGRAKHCRGSTLSLHCVDLASLYGRARQTGRAPG